MPAVRSGLAAMELSLMAGPARHWANLWKPLIDAFGSVLGEVLLRAFQPNHDRIVRLGLQHHVTSGIGHDVTIDAADDAVRHALAAGDRPGRRGWWSGTLRRCSAAARARPCAAGFPRCRRSRSATVRGDHQRHRVHQLRRQDDDPRRTAIRGGRRPSHRLRHRIPRRRLIAVRLCRAHRPGRGNARRRGGRRPGGYRPHQRGPAAVVAKVLPQISVSGHVCDLQTGLVTTIVDPAQPHAQGPQPMRSIPPRHPS